MVRRFSLSIRVCTGTGNSKGKENALSLAHVGSIPYQQAILPPNCAMKQLFPADGDRLRGTSPGPGAGNPPGTEGLLPENEENFEATAQLEDTAGVTNGMATIALGQTPFADAPAPGPVPLQAAEWAQKTDAEIMQRVAAGDDAGLDFLISKYRRPILYFMYRMVHNQAIAEELAQEVFLRVYRSRHSYRAEARFSTWLYRIASNLVVNYARDTKHERNAPNVYLDANDPEGGAPPDVADARPSVEQDLLQQERARQVRACVMALPERQRMAVLMHKYQELNYKEIGAVLKLSESATKSLLFRAYQTLREELKGLV